MASIAEQRLGHALRAALVDLPRGATVPDSEPFREGVTALRYFIPAILAELHREWAFEGLDDIVPVEARKTGDAEIELLGVCCLVSNQTLTPLHVRLQAAAYGDEISWFECRLGERAQDGMVRVPYRCLREMAKRLRCCGVSADQIAWAYHATFGERRV